MVRDSNRCGVRGQYAKKVLILKKLFADPARDSHAPLGPYPPGLHFSGF